MRKKKEISIDSDPRRRAWLEIYPAAIESNARNIKELLMAGCSLMAVVKADGYGHGAETVARAALYGGANQLGVATLQEGIDLRRAGINCPILILGNLVDIEDLRACIYWDLMPTISHLKEALISEHLAADTGKIFGLQIKVDTGMTRLGCDLKDAQSLIENVHEASSLELKGVYTHLALADKSFHETSITKKQQESFESLIKSLPFPPYFSRHIANSAGTFQNKSLHYDMVRVGLAIYGYSPINDSLLHCKLQSALSVKARVSLIRDVPTGVGVSYGHLFTTSRVSRLAVVGIGYGDGVSRNLSGKISVIFRDQFIPQVGAITMDQLVIDITDYPDLVVGSIVTLLGQDKNSSISPHQWSELSGSIPWEVLCGFKNRLPRLVV